VSDDLSRVWEWGCKVLGLWLGAWGLGLGAWGLGLGAWGLGLESLRFTVHGLRVWGLGLLGQRLGHGFTVCVEGLHLAHPSSAHHVHLSVSDFGFRGQDLGLRVYDLGFRGVRFRV
jgi:hypothetical protein